jgi:hypothetical protein
MIKQFNDMLFEYYALYHGHTVEEQIKEDKRIWNKTIDVGLRLWVEEMMPKFDCLSEYKNSSPGVASLVHYQEFLDFCKKEATKRSK